MKLQTPTIKNATHAAVMGASAGVGIGVARATNDFYPEKKLTSGIAKVATAAIAMALFASVKGNDHLSNSVKGMTAGIAGEKLVSGVSDILIDQKVVEATATDSAVKKFALRAFDVKECACADASVDPSPRLVLSSLNSPSILNTLQMQENVEGVYERTATFS